MIHDNSQQQETTVEESSQRANLRVGALGWDHAGWQNTFYPDDLPADWHLGFYANEFNAVLVPEPQWRANLHELEGWQSEVPDNFRFYLQMARLDEVEVEQLTQQLGTSLGAVIAFNVTDNAADFLLPPFALVNYASRNLREWREWLELHGTSLQAVFLADANLGTQQLSDFRSLVEMLGY